MGKPSTLELLAEFLNSLSSENLEWVNKNLTQEQQERLPALAMATTVEKSISLDLNHQEQGGGATTPDSVIESIKAGKLSV
ncbi:hypothetical protein FGW37_30140 [Streptomyces rectiverticillatus]|uniref:hypothetical protein n=1 Tax=Streptomyces rectiverticillatus TaxID=173860 RepID=UPI0015C35A3B|nr:hypothetical protein [Streptomyces rectiverticillatus]QLE75282.1 hypothetical protein FGW37_30140 [Streptomyces rectiverticillatus]